MFASTLERRRVPYLVGREGRGVSRSVRCAESLRSLRARARAARAAHARDELKEGVQEKLFKVVDSRIRRPLGVGCHARGARYRNRGVHAHSGRVAGTAAAAATATVDDVTHVNGGRGEKKRGGEEASRAFGALRRSGSRLRRAPEARFARLRNFFRGLRNPMLASSYYPIGWLYDQKTTKRPIPILRR